MTDKTIIPAKLDIGRAHGVIAVAPNGYLFLIGAAVVAICVYAFGWYITSGICAVLFLLLLNFVANGKVNRAPMNSRMAGMEHLKDKLMHVDVEKPRNETKYNKIILETEDGVKALVLQFLGLITNRIVSYVSVGDKIIAGITVLARKKAEASA